MNTEKMFPMQSEHHDRATRPGGKVPWSVAEMAYQKYVEWYGDSQTLERLAELVFLLKGDKIGIRETIPIIKLAE